MERERRGERSREIEGERKGESERERERREKERRIDIELYIKRERNKMKRRDPCISLSFYLSALENRYISSYLHKVHSDTIPKAVLLLVIERQTVGRGRLFHRFG